MSESKLARKAKLKFRSVFLDILILKLSSGYYGQKGAVLCLYSFIVAFGDNSDSHC